MNNTIESIEYRGFNINIYPDDSPEDPREWDNIGIMACSHPNYILGDKDYSNTKRGGCGGEEVLEAILADVVKNPGGIVEAWGRQAVDKTVEIVEKCGGVIMPLFLLDHSGLWMSTGKYSCDPGGWDTSHVGFIFCTAAKIKEEYGEGAEAMEKARRYLIGEVETYCQWLSGSVYGYSIEPKDTNKGIKCDDSCWGFYGYEWDKNGLLDHAKPSIDYEIEQYKKGVKLEKARQVQMAKFMRSCWAY